MNKSNCDCTYSIELSGSRFQCETCGDIIDATAPVNDSNVSSSAAPIERGRKQTF